MKSTCTWLSPQIEEVGGRRVFFACQISSGECVSTGDYVYLLPSVPEIDLYIGRIESMYEDEKGSKSIHVRWFYRPNDLKHDPPSQPLKNEVYHTNYYDVQLVDSIVRPCGIVLRNHYWKMETSWDTSIVQSTGQYLHVCRYSYTSEANQVFTAIKEEDIAGHAAGLPYLDMAFENGNGEISHEETIIAKEFANRLLNIERYVPRAVTRSDWTMAERLPWILKTKNAMTLDDLKHLLIEVESGLQIFKDEIGWRKSVHAIGSFDTLDNHIRYLKHNVQRKVDKYFTRTRMLDHGRREKRRSFVSAPLEKLPKRQITEGLVPTKIDAGNAYEIDHAHLPVDAPGDLGQLRVVVVSQSSNDEITIKYPRLSSLRRHLKPDRIPAIQRTKIRTNALEPRGAVSRRPILEAHMVLPKNVARKVLKRRISCSEYLHRSHLKAFWFCFERRKDRNDLQVRKSLATRDIDDLTKASGPVTASPQLLQRNDTSKSDGYHFSVRWGVRKRIIYQSPQANNLTGTISRHEDYASKVVECVQAQHSGLISRDKYPIPRDNKAMEYQSKENLEVIERLVDYVSKYTTATNMDTVMEHDGLLRMILPTEEEEICQLKEDVVHLKCQTQTLLLQIEKSCTNSDEAADVHSFGEDIALSKNFLKSIRKQTQEIIERLLKMNGLRRPNGYLVDQKQPMFNAEVADVSICEGDFKLGQLQVAKMEMYSKWTDLLQRINKGIVQLVEDATAIYTEGKKPTKDVHYISETLQADLSVLLNTLKLPQKIKRAYMSSQSVTESLWEPEACCDLSMARTENILLFQMAAGLPPEILKTQGLNEPERSYDRQLVPSFSKESRFKAWKSVASCRAKSLPTSQNDINGKTVTPSKEEGQMYSRIITFVENHTQSNPLLLQDRNIILEDTQKKIPKEMATPEQTENEDMIEEIIESNSTKENMLHKCNEVKPQTPLRKPFQGTLWLPTPVIGQREPVISCYQAIPANSGGRNASAFSTLGRTNGSKVVSTQEEQSAS